jgi:hypothetical protein
MTRRQALYGTGDEAIWDRDGQGMEQKRWEDAAETMGDGPEEAKSMVTLNSNRRLDCVSLYRDGSSEIRTTEKV